MRGHKRFPILASLFLSLSFFCSPVGAIGSETKAIEQEDICVLTARKSLRLLEVEEMLFVLAVECDPKKDPFECTPSRIEKLADEAEKLRSDVVNGAKECLQKNARK